MKPLRGRASFWICLIVIALGAAALALYATREGVGLSPDSDTYLAVAEHLRSGRGFERTLDSPRANTQPLTHYPPLYPLMLAAVGQGDELLVTVRHLNAVMGAIVIVLAGVLFRYGLGTTHAAALVGAAILAASIDLLYINSMVWSDGPFMLLMFIAWLALSRHLERRHRTALLAAALAVGLAMLTRYAAAALAVACAFALLTRRNWTWRQRIADTLLFGAVSGIPIAAWIIRNVAHRGSAFNRPPAFHPPTSAQLHRGLETIAQWLIPTPKDWLIWLGVVACVVLGIIALISARNARREGRDLPRATPLLLSFALLYALFVLAVVTWLDAHTRLDVRILAPLHVALLIVIFAELARSTLPGSRAWPIALKILAAVMIVGQTSRAVLWAREAPEQYIGYSTRKWKSSELLRYIEERIPADALIYTNATALLRLHADRTVKSVPAVMDPRTREPMPDLQQRLRAMERDLENRGGYVIYFDEVRRPQLISQTQLMQELKLRIVYDARDGDVLQLRTGKRQ